MTLRTALFLLSTCWLLPLLAQPAHNAPNRTDEKGRKQGEWAKAWPGGTLRYQGQFKDDRPVGLFRYFDEEGKLTSQVEHAGDGRTSRARHYHPDGGLMATGKYLGQEKDSTWSYYDIEGRTRRVEHFKAGKLHGEQVSYYPGGAVAERASYVDGVQEGAHKAWFANGNLRSECTYTKGEPDGEMRFNHPNGRLESEGKSVKGKREGTWRYYNEDGSLRAQIVFRQGRPVKEKRESGTFIDYYDDERPKSEVNYRKGVREGRFVEYHDNGKWVLKPRPADPVMGTPADIERVLEGQTKRVEGQFRDDRMEGEWKEYDERGRLVRTTHYAAGEPVKGK